MARNDGVDRTVVRNQGRTDASIGDAEKHNERQNECYRNEDIVPERSWMNVHYKQPTGGYLETFQQMEQDGLISTRGLKKDAVHFGELVFDVNSAYFHNHGGYEYAKQFYADAYEAAIKIVGGEQYILSAVMHADERNRGMSEKLGYDVWHYHLHLVYIPVVEKQVLWTKRCKDPALVGTVKETIHQVSHSKKWESKPKLDLFGEPVRTKSGKVVLEKSYSILQDQYHDHMVAAGYTDVERGEYGSTEEHLDTVQFKVIQEQNNLDQIMAQKQAALSAADQAEAKRRNAEAEVALAEKKITVTQDAARNAVNYIQQLGSVDDVLPAPKTLESAGAYRSRVLKGVTLLFSKLKDIYRMYVREHSLVETLTCEVSMWRHRAEATEQAQDKAGRFDRLARVLGLDEINRLLDSPSHLTHDKSHDRHNAR